MSLQPSSRFETRRTPLGGQTVAATPRASTKGMRLESLGFRQMKVPTLPSQYPSMQATQKRLARKRNIQIRVTTGIAFLLTIAAIIQYGMFSYSNRSPIVPVAAKVSAKTPPSTASPVDKSPDSPDRKSDPAKESSSRLPEHRDSATN